MPVEIKLGDIGFNCTPAPTDPPDAGERETHPAIECNKCHWTNTGLLNCGAVGKPRWLCHGCITRLLARIHDEGEVERLRAEVAKAEAEVCSVIDHMPKDYVVQCREGGGPENIYGTLAISVSKMGDVLTTTKKLLAYKNETANVFMEQVRKLQARVASLEAATEAMREAAAQVADAEAKNARGTYSHEQDRRDRELGRLVAENIAFAIRALPASPAPREEAGRE